MTLLHRRPLAAVCLCFLGGLVVAAVTDTWVRWAAIGLSVFLLLLFAFLRRPGRRRVPVLSFACLAGLLFSQVLGLFAYDLPLSRIRETEGRTLTLTVRVEEAPYATAYQATYRGRLLTADGQETGGGIEWTCGADCPVPAAGNTARFTAELLPVQNTRVGYEATYYRANGIHAVAADTVENMEILSDGQRPSDRIRERLSILRENLSDTITESVPGESGALMNAMLLGRRDLLSAMTRRDFRRAGLSHVLALSGLHLSVLTAAFGWLMERIGLHKRLVHGARIVLILFYMALTGFPLSLVRAGVMLLILSLSNFAARQADSVTSLFLAATLIGIADPAAMFDVGLWLSVCATFGILCLSEWRALRRQSAIRSPLTAGAEQAAPPRSSFLRTVRTYLRNSLAVTLSATVGTLPLLCLFFGEISCVAPLSNLLFSPLVSLYLILAFLALPFARIPLFGRAVAWLGDLFLRAVGFIARGRFSVISVGERPVLALVIATGAAAFLLLCTRARKKTFLTVVGGGLGLCAVCLCLLSAARLPQNKLLYTTAGENDAMVLISEGRAMLLDASDGNYAVIRRAQVLLEEENLCEWEALFLTHYHAEHIAALRRLAGEQILRTLYLPAPETRKEQDIYRDLTKTAASLGVTCVTYARQENVAFGAWRLCAVCYRESGRSHPLLTFYVFQDDMDTELFYTNGCTSDGHLIQAVSQMASEARCLYFGTHGCPDKLRIPSVHYAPDLRAVYLPGGDIGKPLGMLYYMRDHDIPVIQEPEGEIPFPDNEKTAD